MQLLLGARVCLPHCAYQHSRPVNTLSTVTRDEFEGFLRSGEGGRVERLLLVARVIAVKS